MFQECNLNSLVDPEGGGGRGSAPTTLKNLKNKGFLCNTGPDSLKITKLPSQHAMVGHYRHASKTSFQWRFAGGPMMAHFKWHFDPLSIPSTEKNVVCVGPPLTILSGSVHALINIQRFCRNKWTLQGL